MKKLILLILLAAALQACVKDRLEELGKKFGKGPHLYKNGTKVWICPDNYRSYQNSIKELEQPFWIDGLDYESHNYFYDGVLNFYKMDNHKGDTARNIPDNQLQNHAPDPITKLLNKL